MKPKTHTLFLFWTRTCKKHVPQAGSFQRVNQGHFFNISKSLGLTPWKMLSKTRALASFWIRRSRFCKGIHERRAIQYFACQKGDALRNAVKNIRRCQFCKKFRRPLGRSVRPFQGKVYLSPLPPFRWTPAPAFQQTPLKMTPKTHTLATVQTRTCKKLVPQAGP